MIGREMSTPIGRVTLGVEAGALVAVWLGHTQGPAWLPAAHPLLDEAERQFRAYFAGDLRHFDLPLRPKGTPFQQEVWAALCEIPYGVTRAYREVADRIGRPTAVRAVGAANGANPLAIVVPCHRVIGASGDLVGYAGGVPIKVWLLAHERGERPLFGVR